MMEILAYFQAHCSINNKRMTGAMKAGFAKAFDKFEGYALAKIPWRR